MSEERMRILQMLAEGKITAEEAEALLSAMVDEKVVHQPKKSSAQFLRVKVWEDGKDKVNVNIPLSLAKLAMKLIPSEAKSRINEHNIDLDMIISEIKQGAPGGKIVDIEDGETRVEVYVD